MTEPTAGSPEGSPSAEIKPATKTDAGEKPHSTMGATPPNPGLSASSLKGVQWFPGPPAPKPKGGAGSALVKLAIGGAVGALFFLAHKPTFAYVVWGIGGTIGALSLASASIRETIDGAFAKLGRWIGTGVGTVLLTLIYVLVVTPTRFVRRLLGADDLHLRDRDRPSYWLPADSDERKVRWVGSMFATEVLANRRGHPLRTALIAIVVLTVLAEGILRTQGFGHAVLYQADPVVGYYPAPNMNLARYGGAVRTNAFGMRSRDIEKKKPEKAFRILMLGDSTLYGGSYIDQDDLYSSRVEVGLDKLGGPGKVEVMAMGANGWGPFHERGYVAKFGTFEADIAIINMPVDDINRPLYGLMDVPFFSNVNPPILGLEEVANHFMWRYRSAHAGLDDAWEAEQSQIGIVQYGHLVDDLHKTVPEVYAAILPGQSAGLGGKEHPREAAWRQQLAQVFHDHGAPVSYPKGLFAGKGRPDELYHDGVHLNPKGHAVYAEFLIKRLQDRSAVLRKWLGMPPPAPRPNAPTPAPRATESAGAPPNAPPTAVPAKGHEPMPEDGSEH